MATFTHTDAHGNDFLLVDAAAVPDQARWPALARRVCDRATGIGADGLIFVTENAAGAAMQLRNADVWAFVGLELEIGWMPLLLDGVAEPGRERLRITGRWDIECNQNRVHFAFRMVFVRSATRAASRR